MHISPHLFGPIPLIFAVTRSDNYGRIALEKLLTTLPTALRVQPVYPYPWSRAETPYQ
jgi:hypothetical protein